jgi:hypothetical protein
VHDKWACHVCLFERYICFINFVSFMMFTDGKSYDIYIPIIINEGAVFVKIKFTFIVVLMQSLL